MGEKIELGEFNLDDFMGEMENANVEVQSKHFESNLQIVLAIDASNSMRGYKVGAVNDAVNNIISKLKSFARSKPNSISVSVIGYASKLFRWTNGFVAVNEFKFSYVETTDGLSDINALFEELKVLSETHMRADAKKVVVLFSDGLPTVDYTETKSTWEHTNMYGDTIRIAVTFDDDLTDSQSMNFFKEFASGGYILSVKNQEQLLSWIME